MCQKLSDLSYLRLLENFWFIFRVWDLVAFFGWSRTIWQIHIWLPLLTKHSSQLNKQLHLKLHFMSVRNVFCDIFYWHIILYDISNSYHHVSAKFVRTTLNHVLGLKCNGHFNRSITVSQRMPLNHNSCLRYNGLLFTETKQVHRFIMTASG